MQYTIENGGKFTQAFKARGGTATVKPGKTKTLTLKRVMEDREIIALAAKGVRITPAESDDGIGPTVEEFVAAGYRAENYPPQGYEARSTPEEIAAAIAAQRAADDAAKIDGLTVEELKAHLNDKGVQFPDNAKKADLVALAKK